MRVVMVQRSDSGSFPWRSYEPRYTSRSIIGAVRYIAVHEPVQMTRSLSSTGPLSMQ